MKVSLVLPVLLLAACGGGGGGGVVDGEAGPQVVSPGPGDMPGAEESDPEPGSDVLSDPVSAPEPDLSAEDVVNADNYVSLAEFAVRINVVVLADRTISPTSFLDDFPGGDGVRLELLSDEAAPGESVTVSDACPLGGTYTFVQTREFTGGRESRTYDGCATDAGTLDGTYEYDSASGGRSVAESHDIEFAYDDGADGPGRTTFAARHERGEFGGATFSVDDYSRNTETNGFAVSGSGSRTTNLFFPDDGPAPSVYGAETTVDLGNAPDPVGLNVTIEDLAFVEDGLVEGRISVVAPDESRVDVRAGDALGTVVLTRTSGTGEAFVDTVAWSELLRPSE